VPDWLGDSERERHRVSGHWTCGTGTGDAEWANVGGTLEDHVGRGRDGVRMRIIHGPRATQAQRQERQPREGCGRHGECQLGGNAALHPDKLFGVEMLLGAGGAEARAANELQPVGQGAVGQRPASRLNGELRRQGGEGQSKGRVGKRIGKEARGDWPVGQVGTFVDGGGLGEWVGVGPAR
jgi:hypothetical protein